MAAKTQVLKWGNSLAVRISKVIANQAELKQGDELVVEVVEGTLVLKPEKRPQALEELVARITRENLHREMWEDGPMGKEIW
jgi:antitoxin MazE